MDFDILLVGTVEPENTAYIVTLPGKTCPTKLPTGVITPATILDIVFEIEPVGVEVPANLFAMTLPTTPEGVVRLVKERERDLPPTTPEGVVEPNRLLAADFTVAPIGATAPTKDLLVFCVKTPCGVELPISVLIKVFVKLPTGGEFPLTDLLNCLTIVPVAVELPLTDFNTGEFPPKASPSLEGPIVDHPILKPGTTSLLLVR